MVRVGGGLTCSVECDTNIAEELIETRWRISLTLAVGRCGRPLRHTHEYILCSSTCQSLSVSILFLLRPNKQSLRNLSHLDQAGSYTSPT